MENYIERELINYLYHDVNRMRHIVTNEIFEYDIQSSIHNFLRYKFDTKKFKIARERNGKVDHVIKEKDSGKTTLIEVKSFIKNHEKFNYKKIEQDIIKTHKKIDENNDNEGYLILIVKQSHLKSDKPKEKELIEMLVGSKRIVYFESIKTRLIKSYITFYKGREDYEIHKVQIRVFMFQIIIENSV